MDIWKKFLIIKVIYIEGNQLEIILIWEGKYDILCSDFLLSLKVLSQCGNKVDSLRNLCKKLHVILKKVGILWNSTLVLKEDKLSTTTVVFIRAEWKLKTKQLYWIWKPKKC